MRQVGLAGARARLPDLLRRAGAVLHGTDGQQGGGIRAIIAPRVPAGVVELLRLLPRAGRPAVARGTPALQLAEQERIVLRELAAVDRKHVHAAEQQATIEDIVAGRRRFAGSRCRCGAFEGARGVRSTG